MKRNRFYCLHPHTHTHTHTHTHGTSWYSILRHIVHLRAYVHMSHVHTTCTKKPWLPSGLVFDRMLSEWLISQCFDLLQLLELCLVRAWIWHTLQIIMWLHYTQCFLFFFFCFFFFQFCFWRDIFLLCLKYYSFDTTLGYFTHTDFTIRRLLSEKKRKRRMQRGIFLQFLYGYYWLVIMITFSFSFFFFFPALSRLFDSNKHSGSSINA